MRFDADAYLAALAPPTLTVGGRTYVGRHLSADEALQHLQALSALDGEGVTDATMRATLTALVDALFPGPITPTPAVSRWRRWWARWGGPPLPAPLRVVDLFLALPLAAQVAAVRGFSEVLASSLIPAGTPGPTTSDVPAGAVPQPTTAPFPWDSSSPASSTGTGRPRGTTQRATPPEMA